ncbi:hypothetical protein J6P11_05060 [bacterium]|nr:hypothetical protein [bacterium]
MKHELGIAFTDYVSFGKYSSYGILLNYPSNLSINQAFSSTNNLATLKNELISTLTNDVEGLSY